MTDDETLVLMMALTAETPLRSGEIAQGLNSTPDHALYVASRLRANGALSKPRYGQWAITERGRIACALSMHKDPTLRAAFFDEDHHASPPNPDH